MANTVKTFLASSFGGSLVRHAGTTGAGACFASGFPIIGVVLIVAVIGWSLWNKYAIGTKLSRFGAFMKG